MQSIDSDKASLSTNTDVSRIQWLKTIVQQGLLALAGIVLLIKVTQMEVKLQQFSLSDVLALVLALFSIWLSVSFYHRATEQSNQFYDNTYKFTKDITSLLSKIEGEFRQRLEHLDVSYTGIADRLSSDLYKNRTELETEVKEQATVVDSAQQAKEQALEEIASRITESERDALMATIRERETALEKARMDLRRAQRRARISGRLGPAQRIAHYIIRGGRPDLTVSDVLQMSYAELARRVNEGISLGGWPQRFIADLKSIGVVTQDGDLTLAGHEELKHILTEALHSSAEQDEDND